MSKQSKSSKSLIIGIVAAIVVLAALVVVFLTQCTGQQSASPTTQTTEPTGSMEDVALYWNVDRALYDGKSEAGMSSRPIEKDGYYHVRFFVNGKVEELKVAERVVVNNIEVRDLMGLVFDEDGIITDVIALEDMPFEKVAWKFYVQSVGGHIIKVNSSNKFDGMDILLDTKNGAKVYDMTGTTGEIGCETTAGINDRVMAVADMNGELLAVYIYDRTMMQSQFEAYCEHCEANVTWVEWKSTSTLPTNIGHFQVQNDITLKAQQSMMADAKICLDLNGHRVDGAPGKRIYSVHNLNGELAIMDTSEGQTGVIAPHGESTTQGLGIWVRYGACYFYGGTIDASDSSTTNAGGTAVYVAAGRFFYMYGGELIGGTALPKYNEKTNTYSNGQGATVFVKGGKFVLYDGVIRDGHAKSVKTVNNGKVSYQRGLGGNIFVSGGTLEIHGGTVKNGTAGAGGNIFADGNGEVIMDGGLVTGGRNTDPGRNCGNIYINTKAKMELSGGRVEYGVTKNLGGNFVIVGQLRMTGGSVTGGKQLDANNKVKENASAANIYITNGTFNMYGGKVDGSVTITDTKADGKRATVGLARNAWIDGSHMNLPGLTVSNGTEKPKVIVDPLHGAATIRVSAGGIFSEKTDVSNLDNFYSDVAGVDVVYTEGCLAMGKLACLCGSTNHFGKCDGTEILWGPWTNDSALPGSEGNYILMTDVNAKSQQTIGSTADQKINLDLNGHTISGGVRTAQIRSKLSVVDHLGGGIITGRGPSSNADHSGVFQVLSGGLDLFAGTLKLADDHYSVTNAGILSAAAGTEVNIYGGTIDARNAGTAEIGEGGAVRMSGVLNVYGGQIFGTETTNNGGAICVWKGGVVNVKGGTITGAKTGAGGTIYLKDGATANISGGTVTGGSADNSIGTDKEKGKGGNILAVGGTTLKISGGKILAGAATDNGGNVAVIENATAAISGGYIGDGSVKGNKSNANANLYVRNNSITISGGEIDGYISLIVSAASHKNSAVKLSGAPVLNGGSTNVRLYAAAAANMPKVEIVGKLTGEPGSIGITMQHKPGAFATGAVETDAPVFFSDDKNYNVVADGNTLRLETPKCLCGADTGAKDDNITHKPWCDGELLNWKVWNGTEALTEGNWYLTGNVTAAQIAVSGNNINLDLAGKKLNATAMDVTGKLQVVDNTGNGELAGNVTSTGKLSVFDAVVTGQIAVNGGEFTVGGNAKLAGVTLAAEQKITLLGLGADADIVLTMVEPGVFAEGVETDVSKAFAPASTDYEILYKESEKQLEYAQKKAHSHCWCVHADVIPEGHVCTDDQVWTPIEKSGTAFTAEAGKHYYLNWTFEEQAAKSITVPDNATVYLCINGAHIRASNVIKLGTNSKVIICDCKDSGIITTTKESPIILKDGQEVTFMSGILAGTYSNAASRVTVLVQGGTFNMYGGSVERGCAKHSNVTAADKKEADGTIGGNIRIDSGVANLFGGSVTGGKLLDGTDRDVTLVDGTLTVGKKVQIGVLYLPAGKTISVVEKDLDTNIGISMEKPGEPIAAVKSNVSAGFTSLVEDYPVLGIVNGNLVLHPELTADGHYHCFCENAEALPAGHKCSTLQQWTALTSVPESATNKFTLGNPAAPACYYLDWTGGKGKSFVVSAGSTVYMCLNGASIYAMTTVTLEDGAVLHICDCSEGQTGQITRSSAATKAPILMESGKQTIYLYSGEITGTFGSKSIVSVNMKGGEPTFHMYGGKITGGSSTTHGGNVSMTCADAKFYLHGGVIENGAVASGKHGGNLYMSHGLFTMDGGKITGGSGATKGGNIILLAAANATAKFVMNGGVIQGGSAVNGGNIAINSLAKGTAIFEMNGGTVKGGTATDNGGTFYLYGSSGVDQLIINGGTVETGTAATGACIYVNAEANGSGVTVAEGATVGQIVKK